MKLKYYLRGLGIGIFVTALIMTIVSSGKGAMTDTEIMERAAELGMVTPKTLSSQVQESDVAQESEEPVRESLEMEAPVHSTESPVETTEAPEESEPVETQEPVIDTEPTAEPTEAPTEVPKAEPVAGEKVMLTIYSGEHSATVAKRMEELGLVEDYLDFDDYLCDNGYSRSVNSGVYKIQPGLSYEELAKIITRTN